MPPANAALSRHSEPLHGEREIEPPEGGFRSTGEGEENLYFIENKSRKRTEQKAE